MAIKVRSSSMSDIDNLENRIFSIEQTVQETNQKLTIPKATVSVPDLNLLYPVQDNEFSFGLMNMGGGAILVPEIELVVEDPTNETRLSIYQTEPHQARPIYLMRRIIQKLGIKPNSSHLYNRTWYN